MCALAMSAPTIEELQKHKAVGNDAYKAKDYQAAITAYGAAVKGLPLYEEVSDDEDEAPPPPPPPDPELLKAAAVVLCNRAACYMAINKPIPANADAQRGAFASLRRRRR